VRLFRDAQVVTVHSDEQSVTAHCRRTRAGSITARAGYLCGCDGKHSSVRPYVSDTWGGRHLRESFAMADITDDTDLGDQAHLYFTREGSVESFPLPGGVRRWIVETDRWHAQAPPGLVQNLVTRRTGIVMSSSAEHWRSTFLTERRRAARWHRRRVLLAGDAAHVMPPIGGQGMNVGFGDAEHLADLLILAHRDGRDGRKRLMRDAKRYESRRRRAFEVAARRSILGMKIGAARGTIRSTLRSAIIRGALRGAAANWIMEHFAMIASPCRRSPWRREADQLTARLANRHNRDLLPRDQHRDHTEEEAPLGDGSKPGGSQ
jgi:2-polyprenyl-6-methoxyphenol hydroxylase-like FAD-dependent oxidoreductase